MIWSWNGIGPSGHIRGRMRAQLAVQVYHRLRELEIRPLRVRAERGLAPMLARWVSARKKPLFLRKLGMMLSAGMGLSDALSHLQDELPASMAASLCHANLELGAGQGIEAAFASTDLADETLLATLAAGVASGNMAYAVQSLSVLLERRRALRNAVTNTAMYPLALMVMGMGLCLFTMLFLVPLYRDLYQDSASLPGSTQLLFLVADAVQQPGFWVSAALVGGVLIWGVTRLKRTRQWHGVLLRLPFLGELIRCNLLAQTLHLLALLVGQGVGMHSAIKICCNEARNPRLRQLLQQAQQSLESGQPLGRIFNEKLLGADLPALIGLADQSADLSGALQLAAEYYSERLEVGTSKLRALLEPLMICFIGGIVGGLLLSIYLPLFSLGQAF